MLLKCELKITKEAAPVRPQVAQVPKPSLHDVATRRARLEATRIKNFNLREDVDRQIRHVSALDGHNLVVSHRFQGSSAS